LRLNFQTNEERLARLDDQAAFKNLAKSKKKGDKKIKEIEEGEKYQKIIKAVLASMDSNKLYKNRENFIEDVKAAFEKEGDKVKAPIIKIIVKALSERDKTADICCNAKGNPEADTELRDYENIPLQENIEEYFKREVLPHVPGAWMDRSKDKVGYEINFTKEFYKYKPLRPLEEIRNDILALEKETEGLMNEILKL
jgi:type I restriction enzyme M protein